MIRFYSSFCTNSSFSSHFKINWTGSFVSKEIFLFFCVFSDHWFALISDDDSHVSNHWLAESIRWKVSLAPSKSSDLDFSFSASWFQKVVLANVSCYLCRRTRRRACCSHFLLGDSSSFPAPKKSANFIQFGKRIFQKRGIQIDLSGFIGVKGDSYW